MGLVETRPEEYDVDKIWDESTGVWLDPYAIDPTGGKRRYQTQLIVVGTTNDGKGKVFFEEIPVAPEPETGIQEYYNTFNGSVGNGYFGKTRWLAQTFTALNTYTIASLKLNLYKATGKTVGTLTAAIYTVDIDGKPDSELCSGTIDGDEITTTPSFTCDIEITIDTPVQLNAGTQYAIVLSAPDASATNSINWRWDAIGLYAGGVYLVSTNSGSSWTITSGRDYQFEVYSG
jgi:hypothetical protein